MYSFIRLVAFVRRTEWAENEPKELVPRGAGQASPGSVGWGQALLGRRDLPRGVQVAPTQLRFIAPKREKHLPCQSLFAQFQRRGKGRIKWRHLGQYRRRAGGGVQLGGWETAHAGSQSPHAIASSPKETTKAAQGSLAANCSVTLLKYSLRAEWEEEGRR